MSSKISASESYTVKGEQLLELGRRCDRAIEQSFNMVRKLNALLSHIQNNGFRAEEAAELGLIYAYATLTHRNIDDDLRAIAFKFADKPVDGGVNG